MPTKSKLKTLLTLLVIAGSLFSACVAGSTVATYTYDELDRLTRVAYDDGTAIVYTYDEIGNRLQKKVILPYTSPTANFTAFPISGNSPLTIHFTDTSTGKVTTWLWNFGDGSTTDSQQNPYHTYNNAGTFTITLTVSNPAGSNSVTKTNYITAQASGDGYIVRLVGKGNYTTLQDAYNAAVTGDVIQAQALIFTENLNANRDISITIDGGYNSDYSTNPGTTNLLGMITISSGTLNIKNFVLDK